MTLNRISKVPLYHQLYEQLRGRILRGDWGPGDMLPTENELIAAHDVSRNTVRQALDALLNEGLISRQRGRGTFVTRPPLEANAGRIVSFTEDARQRGLIPATRVLSSELLPAPAAIAEALGVAPGEELAHLRRLRLAGGEPLSIEDTYLLHRLCPGILGQEDYARSPLREALARQGVYLVRAHQKIRAINAPPDMAHLLAVAPGAALLSIERISSNEQDVPVEYLRVVYRGDRYTLYNELRG